MISSRYALVRNDHTMKVSSSDPNSCYMNIKFICLVLFLLFCMHLFSLG